ncbi:MAG: response regulator [Anaerolineales bacterium]|nr:response regulator [Anaerolineales bacterium]
MAKPLALIVEDDRDIVALFQHVLDIAGYQTETALNGPAALDLIKKNRPDIILLDLNLPGITGLEIIQKIRSDENNKNTRIVVITGYSNIVESTPYKADLVLLKPVNVDQLLNLIKRLLPTDGAVETRPNDELTGLYSQPFFISRLDYALARSKQLPQDHFAVILIVLNQLKDILDQLGSEMTDNLLKETADSIKRMLRPTDTIGRYNNSRFIILIEDIPGQEALDVIAERIRKGLKQSLRNFGKDYNGNTRMVILLCDSNYQDVDEILCEMEQSLSH